LISTHTITYDKPIEKKYLEYKVRATLNFMKVKLPAKVRVITPDKIYELHLLK
jgi:hypothetical protein